MLKRSIAALLAVPLLAACGQTTAPTEPPQTDAPAEAPAVEPATPAPQPSETSASATPSTPDPTVAPPEEGLSVAGPTFLLMAPTGWVVDKQIANLGTVWSVQISKGRKAGKLQQVVLEVTRNRSNTEADAEATAKKFAGDGCPNPRGLAPRPVAGSVAVGLGCNEGEIVSQHYFFHNSGRIYSLSYLVDGTPVQEPELSFILDNLRVSN